jgi:hypothetical protein
LKVGCQLRLPVNGLDENKTVNTGVEIKTESDLMPPGAVPGTVPTDLEQSTGLERLEILGKMQGVDIFDMKPLDASRKGKTYLLSRDHTITMLGQLRQKRSCSTTNG